jgi:hypothetical protein
MVSWKGACGKHIEESVKVEDVLSWGEGVCEEKPLRLVIGECTQFSQESPSFPKWRPCRLVIGLSTGPKVKVSKLEYNSADISYHLPLEGNFLPFLSTYRITDDLSLVYSMTESAILFTASA